MIHTLAERWRTTVPGEVANVFLCDPTSGSLFVGDGDSVAYAALRLHRLDLSSGAHLAELRTRHQRVSALALHADHLYVATDSRLFELQGADLSIIRQWDRRLVQSAMQVVPDGATLAMANWLMPGVGIFDLDTGRIRRLPVGRQPLLVHHGGVIKVLAGFDGGMWTLDTQRGRLTQATATPPVTAIGAGAHRWAVLAGAAESVSGHSDNLVKRGSNRLTRLTGEPWTTTLSGPCSKVVCDDVNGVVWCIIDSNRAHRSGGLQAVSQTTGQAVTSFVAAPGQSFAHVDPTADLAFTLEPHRRIEGGRVVACTSTLVCYSLH